MTAYPNDELAQFFSKTLAETDPAIKASIDDELGRQKNQIELIASENIVSKDRKSTRLNSSHLGISYAVFCLKKKKQYTIYNNKL